jgi:hypothetical protein
VDRIVERREIFDRRQIAAVAACLPFVLLLQGCDRLLTTRLRCQLTAHARVDGRSYRGSSVVEIGSQPEWMPFAEGAKRNTWVKGEAITVATPRRTFLVTLDVPAAGTLPVAIVESFEGHVGGPVQFGAKLKMLAHQVGRTAALSPNNFPTIIFFEDPARPETITPTLPPGNAGTASTAFNLYAVELRITNDPVTNTIYQYLPWLKRISEERHFKSDRGRYDFSYAGMATRSTLIRGQ